MANLGMIPLLPALVFLGCGGPRSHVEPPPPEIRAAQTDEWMARVQAVGQAGDWLVIRGYKPADDVVVAATNAPLSHAAVLDLDRGEVVEALADGVVVNELRHFLHHAHRVQLIRPRWASAVNGRVALERARGVIGKGYDFSGLVGLSVEDRFYCSELCVYAWTPFKDDSEQIPRIIEPAGMDRWGTILFDSGSRD